MKGTSVRALIATNDVRTTVARATALTGVSTTKRSVIATKGVDIGKGWTEIRGSEKKTHVYKRRKRRLLA